jgi:hypothetical protein
MARKSQSQRTQEAQELLAAYQAAGFSDGEWAVRFLTSVISQMARSRYPSKRQRDRIDAMVVEGVPTPQGDTQLLEKMDAAVAYWTAANEREWERKVIVDMRRGVFNGWNMSEKQIKLLNDIIQRHQDDVTGANVFTPTAEQRADLEVLVKLYKGYASQWQQERPAVEKAIVKVNAFLGGSGTIEEYHFNKLNKAMGAKLRRFKNPRFNMCDMGKLITTAYTGSKATKRTEIVTAMTDAYVNERGTIGNDFLLPSGSVEFYDAERIGKIRKRKSS